MLPGPFSYPYLLFSFVAKRINSVGIASDLGFVHATVEQHHFLYVHEMLRVVHYMAFTNKLTLFLFCLVFSSVRLIHDCSVGMFGVADYLPLTAHLFLKALHDG
jgi:hypothetical protein